MRIKNLLITNEVKKKLTSTINDMKLEIEIINSYKKIFIAFLAILQLFLSLDVTDAKS